jgi:DNA-binding winged helix-turn-helix (wHTH) protein/Tol biopolymer transport system component
MNPKRWHQVEQIYNSVLERNPEDRNAFLEKACAGDEALRKEVESLLACNGEGAAFIQSPAVEEATKVLAEDSEYRTSLVGRTLLHFSIQVRIGEGGMGVVYKARDNHLNRDVAIKVLPVIFAQDPQRLARFEREARAVAALSHPNILGIYDLCSADGVTFAAMELLDGETLRERLNEGGLPVRKAIDYAMQMAQGLAAAHGRGVVHRDLKPENLFLTKEGRVKILDFGLAKLRSDTVSGAETITARTMPGVLMGTLGYMSPEQVRGKDADARSDIFALGAILYEMLSERRAFKGNSDAETIIAILKDDPPEFTHLRKRGSPGIERIVRRCLEKNPYERFQSARDISFALEAVGTDSETPEPTDKLSAVDGDLQIGRWLVQQQLNAIRAGRKTTRIEPKAMEVLLCMARHAGAVVSREALLHEVWGDTLVTDSALTRCIAELRKVFDDDVKEPRVIETIANQGYRLVAAVRPAARIAATVPRRPGWWAIGAVATLGVLAAFGVWLWTSRSPSNPAAVTRLTANLGNEIFATDLQGHNRVLAISPDGSTLAYIAREAGTRRLYLRPISSFAGRAVPGTEGASAPFFSPDGVWVGFGAKGKLYKLPVAGGPPLQVCDATLRGGSWGEDGKIVFTDVVGLHRVSAAGGAPELLARPEGNEYFSWPEILPDGARALVTVSDDIGPFRIDLFKLSDGSRKKVISERGFPRYLATGHIAFTLQGQVMIVPFDPGRLTVTGTPFPVLAGVGDFAVSRSGTLCYATDADQRSLAWLDRRGLVTALPVAPQRYHQPVLAPDGRRIAVTLEDDIWIYSLEGDVVTPLTFDHNGLWPIWTPDGRQVIYASRHGRGLSLVRKNVDGTGEPERLVSDEYSYSPMSCSPDGRLLVFDRWGNNTGKDVWVLPLVGERRAEPLIATANNEGNGVVSPDGRWIAYISDESGRIEVYVRGFPRSSGKWQVSTEGAREPLWSRGGRELFYRTLEGNLKVVAVTLDPVFSAGKARLVYSGPFRMGGRSNYDITPEGDRFLIVTDSEAAPIKQLRVVLNWLTEIKAHVRAKN